MIDFFTTLLTPLFITLGLVSSTPEPILTPEPSQQEQIVQLQERIDELENKEVPKEVEQIAQEKVQLKNTPKQVIQKTKSKIDLEKYKIDTNVVAKTDVIQKLNNDIYDLSVMRDVIEETRDKHIAQARTSAEFKAQSLNDLAVLFADKEQKEYVRNRADSFSGHKNDVSSSYSELYGYLIDRVVEKKTELQQLRNKIAESNFSGKLGLSLGISDDEYFEYISEFKKTNKLFFENEERYEVLFDEAMLSIKNIGSWNETTSDFSNKLLEIENEANNSSIMDTDEQYCWSTTNYEGGLINGTFQTSTVCR